MFFKSLAALSGFVFVGLAAMFGTNFSVDITNLVVTTMSILLFVAATAVLLGIVFGRDALIAVGVSGSIVLFIMWFPFQFYATEQSMLRSAVALLAVMGVLGPSLMLGGFLRTFVARRLHGTPNQI
jgi:hypothetical protein